jgi:hypothetical protein
MYRCVGETGPGAMFGPAMPPSIASSTVRARTRCRLAVLPREQRDSQALPGVAE